MLIEYLPKAMQGIKELKIITQVEDDVLLETEAAVRKCLDAGFIAYTDSDGLERWERLFKIKPKSGDSVEERRLAVSTRLLEGLPYTEIMLNRELAKICGGDYTLVIDCMSFTVIVRLGLRVQNMLNIVESLLRGYVPANMIIDIDLMYNTYNCLSGFKHNEFNGKNYDFLRRGVLNENN
ncbi:MAG: YmfQ family protein [Oscillospiraceae bacterium]|nr:YmfQ family protein [Oscillospiraceae bacterium]